MAEPREGLGQTEDRPGLPGTVGYRRVLPQCRPGRYTVRQFHARGGMGEVWLADDEDIGRPVALKRLRRERDDQTDRFLAEAQITGQMEHPGIVPVHDLGIDEDGRPFYIMSFVAGRTLKEVIADYHGPNAKRAEQQVQRLRLLEAFVKLCQTVAYAHSRGVIHRDLKPDNVMLGPYGETVVLDWGLAKVQGQPADAGSGGYVHLTYGSSSSATQYGAVLGAPPYMAPEEAEGKAAEADERTDVYLLGATLYEILTGRPPRQGGSRDELIELARTTMPLPPRQVNPQVPRALEAVCLRALARRPQDRYATALELAQEVQRYLAGEPVAACSESFVARAWRWCRRHRTALGRSAVAALVLGLALGGLALLHHSKQRLELAEEQERTLRQREQAREQVKEFRRLADELHFHAAGNDSPAEKAAPYYDRTLGEKAGRAALTVARAWGPELLDLPLEKERPALKSELHALLLLLVQVRLRGRLERPAAEELLALLDQAAALGGSSPSLHRLRARCYEQLGDRERSRQEQQRARASRAPLPALEHFLRGEEHRARSAGPGQPSADRPGWRQDPAPLHQAVVEYRAALALEPAHYWANFQLGRCQLALGQTREAVQTLGACVALRPKEPWGYSARGLALTFLRRFPEAERDLGKALELQPGFAPALLNRGVLWWRQGKHDKALDDLAAVLAAPRERRLIEAAYYRGLVQLERGKHVEALKELQRVVVEQPSFWPVYLLCARAYFALGQDERGLEQLDHYLTSGGRLDPSAAETHELRGRLLRRLLARKEVPATKGRLAVQQLLEAEKLGGRSATLFAELGALARKPTVAVKYYTRALASEPGNTRLRLMRGWAYAQDLKDYKQGEADFARALRVEPGHPEARRIRAEAHTGLGFVHARRKAGAEAQREAALALLHGGRHYLIIHNVACIFAELALVERERARQHQDTCLEHLRRAVELWQRGGKGPNEVALIKAERSFASLRSRPDFWERVKGAKE
jgi:tetratricopeptide (TPR) repeat protein/tRNA A-37 threonylcarbamoyl transferase component Bud32